MEPAVKKLIYTGVYLLLIIICCLLFLRYIFLYNSGNRQYQKANYEKAIESYEKALRALPPKSKECSIRINLALSMVYNLGDDYAHLDNIDDSIATLKQARTVLLEEDCATTEGNGHSETAEQLKVEIEELIKELEQQAENAEGEEDDTQEGDSSDEEDAEEQSIKEQLQQMQNDAYQERQEQLTSNEEFNAEINFDLETPIW